MKSMSMHCRQARKIECGCIMHAMDAMRDAERIFLTNIAAFSKPSSTFPFDCAEIMLACSGRRLASPTYIHDVPGPSSE
jgi:hypothetical protein